LEIKPSRRIASLGFYPFAEVDRRVKELRDKGIEPIDFGVGDPTVPTPAFIRNSLKRAAETRKSAGYPSYIGSREYREAVAAWNRRRFQVDLNPEREISSTIGSGEAIFNFPEAFVDPGDIVLVPNPGYPRYQRGTLFAEGKSFFYPLTEKNGFLPDLDSIPGTVLEKTKILWLNYPNSPTGKVAPPEFLKKVLTFARKHNIIVASDEAYSEIYFTAEPPHSLLEYGREGVIVFNSLSKRSAMTCYRVGWVAGDERIIDIFKKLKTNIDSGTPTFIQDAAVTALGDEKHVARLRREYRAKRDIMIEAFTSVGLPDCTPEATLYIWQRIPRGISSVEFSKLLLDERFAVVTTPGSWLSDEVDGFNPGEGYVRLALVPSIDQCRQAARRLRDLKI